MASDMYPPIRAIPCTDAADYFGKLREFHINWDGFTWLFRGQNSDFDLLPKAMRPDFQIGFVQPVVEDYLNTYPPIHSVFLNDPELYKLQVHRVLQRYLESRLVEFFAKTADEADLFVPTDSKFDLGGEYKRIHETDVNDAINGNSEKMREPVSIVDALARHHDIPTRLLDWSFNPLVAAFFAAYEFNPDEENGSRNGTSDMVVWAINRSALMSFTELRPVTHLRSRIDFMRAQDGLFLLDMSADERFIDEKRWVPFEQEIKRIEVGNAVCKFYIPWKERHAVLKELKWYGVSRERLMPTFKNVADSTIDRFRNRPKSLLEG